MTEADKPARTRRGGRHTMAEVRDLARKHTKLAIDTLAEIARTSDKEAVRIAAANALLERGWGKAVSGSATDREEVDAAIEVITGIDRDPAPAGRSD